MIGISWNVNLVPCYYGQPQQACSSWMPPHSLAWLDLERKQEAPSLMIASAGRLVQQYVTMSGLSWAGPSALIDLARNSLHFPVDWGSALIPAQTAAGPVRMKTGEWVAGKMACVERNGLVVAAAAAGTLQADRIGNT